MKVVKAEVAPLQYKHYSTDVEVVVMVEGQEYDMGISVVGYAPKASQREVARGWEPDWGMDHVESETHLAIAKVISAALAELNSDSCAITKGTQDE